MSFNLPLTEETAITLSGDWSSPEANLLSDAWLAALGMDHKLPDWIRYMSGMSGKKFRYLLNKLVELVPNPRYLEIGSWAGSTACSAMWGNTVNVTCIENWSHYGGPKDQFQKNSQQALSPNINLTLIEEDFRKVDYSNIGKFNIYMYDGPHSLEDQYDGLMIAQPALDDLYYLVVDDYNQKHDVQAGTDKAFKELGHKVIAQIQIITRWDTTHPALSHERSDWHNGYFIALVSKQ